MKLIPLASSSHGNAYLVEDGTTCLLIECGVSWKKLQKLTGFGVSGIAGCLISHEHKDQTGPQSLGRVQELRHGDRRRRR